MRKKEWEDKAKVKKVADVWKNIEKARAPPVRENAIGGWTRAKAALVAKKGVTGQGSEEEDFGFCHGQAYDLERWVIPIEDRAKSAMQW